MEKKISLFIQARQKSTRFPNKIFTKINNRYVFKLIFDRMNLSKKVNKIFYLIPKKDLKLKKKLNKFKIPYFLGSEKNVIDRFFKATQKTNSEILVRITADCPLSDPYLLDKMLEIFKKENLDYLSNTFPPTFPDGLDIEIFSSECLKKLIKFAKNKNDKEHVTSFIRSNPSKFKIGNIFLNKQKDFSKHRITLDYIEDLEDIVKIFKKFYPKINFNYKQILNFLDKNPNIKQHYNRNIGYGVLKSKDLWNKAIRLIPDGNSFLSKHPRSFNDDNWPIYYSSTSKQYIYSYDQIKYLDMSMMSVGTNLLGYNNKNIDKKINSVVKKGNMSSLNCVEEVHLAEKLIDMHKWSDMAKFARTGAEANCIGLRAARLATGKEKIVICGYHGWHDWYLAANINNKKNLNNHLFKDLQIEGVPKNLKNFIYSFEYNNLKKLENIVKLDNNIAAIIMEVKRDINPKNDFLKKVRHLCDRKNIVLIFDECTSAFRENFGGLHLKYKIQPDLAMFGKALGNGYPITSIIGKKSIMETLSDSFVSSTFWSDRIGPTAGLASLKEMENQKSWEILLNLGYYFRKKIKNFDQKDLIEINKEGIIPNISLKLNPLKTNKKNLISFFLKNNIITSDRIYLSTAHTKININKYFEVLEKFLDLVKKQKHFLI